MPTLTEKELYLNTNAETNATDIMTANSSGAIGDDFLIAEWTPEVSEIYEFGAGTQFFLQMWAAAAQIAVGYFTIYIQSGESKVRKCRVFALRIDTLANQLTNLAARLSLKEKIVVLGALGQSLRLEFNGAVPLIFNHANNVFSVSAKSVRGLDITQQKAMAGALLSV